MKLEPVTKLDKGNKTTSKRTDDDAMSVIIIFSLFFVNLEPDYGCIVYKTYIFINNSLLSY